MAVDKFQTTKYALFGCFHPPRVAQILVYVIKRGGEFNRLAKEMRRGSVVDLSREGTTTIRAMIHTYQEGEG